MEEEKNKIDRAIEQAIRQVGQERDAEDIATLKRFMYEQEEQKLQPCSKEADLFEYNNSPKSHNSGIKSFIAIITSIAAIIIVVFSLNIYQDNRQMDKAFETYYTPLEYDSQLMSRGDDTLSPDLVSAMESYQNKDYATALQKFNAMPQVDENYLIYKAICLLETDKTKDAISLLEELVGNGEGTVYYQQACWYLALAYLQNHQKEKAIELSKTFNKIHHNYDINLLINEVN